MTEELPEAPCEKGIFSQRRIEGLLDRSITEWEKVKQKKVFIGVSVIDPPRMIDGKRCMDGDLADKIPFRPLAEAGYDRIIVIHLNTFDKVLRWKHEYHKDTADAGRVRLYHLYPDQSLGSFLWITRSLTRKRMARGFHDGMTFLSGLDRLMDEE